MSRRTSRRRRGLRFWGLVLRYGEIPPASGVERRNYLLHHGHRANTLTATLVERSTAAVEFASGTPLPAWLTCVPPEDHTAEDARRDLVDAGGLLAKLALSRSPTPTGGSGSRPLPGESDARSALRSAVQAYHWLAETEDAELAHHNLHLVGRYVSVLFGCHHLWDEDDESWYEVCPVRLAHIPFGCSAGFTARYICSICGDDPSECEHHPADTFEIVASRITERCSICESEDSCTHELGTRYPVHPRAIWSDPVLHEVSLVPRPRDPLARIKGIEIRDAGPDGHPGVRWRCVQCDMACSSYRHD